MLCVAKERNIFHAPIVHVCGKLFSSYFSFSVPERRVGVALGSPSGNAGGLVAQGGGREGRQARRVVDAVREGEAGKGRRYSAGDGESRYLCTSIWYHRKVSLSQELRSATVGVVRDRVCAISKFMRK